MKELYQEVKLMHMNDHLKLGATGVDKQISGKRFDKITYIDVEEIDEVKSNDSSKSFFFDFIQLLDDLICSVCNDVDELKDKTINRGNIMVSCYEKDAYYISHVDNPNQNGRILTALMYLNPFWEQGHGGELIIHRCSSRTHSYVYSFHDQSLLNLC